MCPASDVPSARGGLPLLGHLLPLLRDPFAFLSSLPGQGDLVRIGTGRLSTVVVCDPDLSQQMLRHDQIFDKGGPVYKRLAESVGEGLATCPHAMHRRQRRLLQPAFHTSRMPGYGAVMSNSVASRVGAWQEGQVLDVYPEMQELTSRVTAAALFGSTLPDRIVRQALMDVTTVMNGTLRRALTPQPLDRIPTPGYRAYRRAITRLRNTLDTIVAERRVDGIDRGDLLSALVTASDTDVGRPGLANPEVVDQIITFFVGGTETTASALTWALHLLDQHRDIAARLHAEADVVLAGRPARYDDLPQLELTGRIITETLRHRPPAWVLSRVVAQDTTLGRYRLPAGTTLVFSPYVIHHRADLHPDPDSFDPERKTTGPEAPPPAATVPFGDGARKCIGKDFSQMEAALMLATIAGRWRLLPLPHNDVRPAVSLALRPRRLQMRVIART